jgi:hypothetical protein
MPQLGNIFYSDYYLEINAGQPATESLESLYQDDGILEAYHSFIQAFSIYRLDLIETIETANGKMSETVPGLKELTFSLNSADGKLLINDYCDFNWYDNRFGVNVIYIATAYRLARYLALIEWYERKGLQRPIEDKISFTDIIELNQVTKAFFRFPPCRWLHEYAYKWFGLTPEQYSELTGKPAPATDDPQSDQEHTPATEQPATIEDEKAQQESSLIEWDGKLYQLALDMRERKNNNEFNTFEEAYIWACSRYTFRGKPITLKQIEQAYYSAKSQALF